MRKEKLNVCMHETLRGQKKNYNRLRYLQT